MPIKAYDVLANRNPNPLVGDEFSATDTLEHYTCFVAGAWVKTYPEAGSGPPGSWTQIGKGPTTIADNTEVTVLGSIVLAAGEIPDFCAIMKDVPASNIRHGFDITSAPGLNEATFGTVKLTSGNIDFRIKHREGTAQDFDWVAYKVLPA